MTEEVVSLGSLPQSDDPEFHSFTEDFEHRFFDGAEQVRFEVTLMRETWDDLCKVITENEWKPNEGLVILLTTGMAFLRAERALSVSEGVAGLSRDEVKKLLDRHMVIEARYASIKNFAFDIMRDHRTLEMKYVPIEREYLHFKGMVWPLRRENDALKAEINQLKQELQARESNTDETVIPERRGGWQAVWDDLRAILHRSR